ncbi:hypothetical protein PtrSN001A_011879, partial [Pyrenophora tritici-repentis]
VDLSFTSVGDNPHEQYLPVEPGVSGLFVCCAGLTVGSRFSKLDALPSAYLSVDVGGPVLYQRW